MHNSLYLEVKMFKYKNGEIINQLHAAWIEMQEWEREFSWPDKFLLVTFLDLPVIYKVLKQTWELSYSWTKSSYYN